MAIKEYKYSNNSVTRLAGIIQALSTTIIITTGDRTKFPVTYPFALTLEEFDVNNNLLKREVVEVTAGTGDLLTVSRAIEPCIQSQNATTQTQNALDFAEGAIVSLRVTADQMQEINQKVFDIPEADDIMDLSTNQTVLTGIKTFTNHPRQSSYIAPTLNEQYTPKQYVDDSIVSASTPTSLGIDVVLGEDITSGDGQGAVYFGLGEVQDNTTGPFTDQVLGQTSNNEIAVIETSNDKYVTAISFFVRKIGNPLDDLEIVIRDKEGNESLVDILNANIGSTETQIDIDLTGESRREVKNGLFIRRKGALDGTNYYVFSKYNTSISQSYTDFNSGGPSGFFAFVNTTRSNATTYLGQRSLSYSPTPNVLIAVNCVFELLVGGELFASQNVTLSPSTPGSISLNFFNKINNGDNVVMVIRSLSGDAFEININSILLNNTFLAKSTATILGNSGQVYLSDSRYISSNRSDGIVTQDGQLGETRKMTTSGVLAQTSSTVGSLYYLNGFGGTYNTTPSYFLLGKSVTSNSINLFLNEENHLQNINKNTIPSDVIKQVIPIGITYSAGQPATETNIYQGKATFNGGIRIRVNFGGNSNMRYKGYRNGVLILNEVLPSPGVRTIGDLYVSKGDLIEVTIQFENGVNPTPVTDLRFGYDIVSDTNNFII